MTVKHWTSKNDANHSNRHAMVEGSDIEFFAFPYQSYYAAKNKLSAIVGDLGWSPDGFRWSVTIYKAEVINNYTTGRTNSMNQKHFSNKDEAFEWADQELHKGE